jgi:hypothetical protein
VCLGTGSLAGIEAPRTFPGHAQGEFVVQASEVAGFAGVGLAGAPYVPQITHLSPALGVRRLSGWFGFAWLCLEIAPGYEWPEWPGTNSGCGHLAGVGVGGRGPCCVTGLRPQSVIQSGLGRSWVRLGWGVPAGAGDAHAPSVDPVVVERADLSCDDFPLCRGHLFEYVGVCPVDASPVWFAHAMRRRHSRTRCRRVRL